MSFEEYQKYQKSKADDVDSSWPWWMWITVIIGGSIIVLAIIILSMYLSGMFSS